MTNVHYSLEQPEYFKSLLKELKNNAKPISALEAIMKKNPKSIQVIMQKLKDLLLAPNLETLSHRNHMFMIGNDFAFTNKEEKREFEL